MCIHAVHRNFIYTYYVYKVSHCCVFIFLILDIVPTNTSYTRRGKYDIYSVALYKYHIYIKCVKKWKNYTETMTTPRAAVRCQYLSALTTTPVLIPLNMTFPPFSPVVKKTATIKPPLTLQCISGTDRKYHSFAGE